MRTVNVQQQEEEADFAKRACRAFAENPKIYTFTDGDVKAGELLAIRWNTNTALILKLDDCFIPACYPCRQFAIPSLPPLIG